MDCVTIGAVLVPVFVGMFKPEIIDIFSDYMVYRRREYKEGCELEILNPYLEEWARIVVTKYAFSFSKVSRVVSFRYVGTDRVERIPYKSWFNFRKSTVGEHTAY